MAILKKLVSGLKPLDREFYLGWDVSSGSRFQEGVQVRLRSHSPKVPGVRETLYLVGISYEPNSHKCWIFNDMQTVNFELDVLLLSLPRDPSIVWKPSPGPLQMTLRWEYQTEFDHPDIADVRTGRIRPDVKTYEFWFSTSQPLFDERRVHSHL